MLEIEIKDVHNKVTGKMPLSKEVFDAEAAESVVHSAVVGYLANQRQGTHATKTRGLVSGGGKKPYKQKHTGRARQGSTRSPLWRHGGTIFGPQPRDYSVRLPRNAKKAGLFKALTMKLADGEVMVVDSFPIEKPKTKDMCAILKSLELSAKTVLIVLPELNQNILLSTRNIPGVEITAVSDLNAYRIATYDTVVFTADALARLQSGKEGEIA